MWQLANTAFVVHVTDSDTDTGDYDAFESQWLTVTPRKTLLFSFFIYIYLFIFIFVFLCIIIILKTLKKWWRPDDEESILFGFPFLPHTLGQVHQCWHQYGHKLSNRHKVKLVKHIFFWTAVQQKSKLWLSVHEWWAAMKKVEPPSIHTCIALYTCMALLSLCSIHFCPCIM